MTLDSKNDKNHEDIDATPDSESEVKTSAESEATTESATDTVTPEATPEAAEAAEAHAEAEAVSEDAEASDEEAAEAEAADEDDEEAEEAEEHDEHAGASTATVASEAASSKTSMPTKVIAAVLILAFAGAVFLFLQRSSTKAVGYNLSKHDMEVLFQDMLSPQEQAQYASTPDGKKKLADEVRKLLAVAAFADSEGYAQHPDVQSQLALQTDFGLNQLYREKYPDSDVTDDEVNAYFQAHPNEFDTFVQSDPRFQQQASGPNREGFKKEFGKFKVMAERARKEKLDDNDMGRLTLLINRAQVLRGAYLNDYKKNADKLVSDEEVSNYYNQHQSEFEEYHARHIIISTQPPRPSPDAAKAGAPQPKAPSKEEARKKAEEVLAKVRQGGDFAALAKQYSDDPGSKDKGGDLDFQKHGALVPEFENAALALKPGQVSDVVESQFGFHIIKLEEKRQPGPTDPQVHQAIVDKLKNDKVDGRIEEIAKTSNVSVPDDFDATVKAPPTPQMPAGHPPVPNQQ